MALFMKKEAICIISFPDSLSDFPSPLRLSDLLLLLLPSPALLLLLTPLHSAYLPCFIAHEHYSPSLECVASRLDHFMAGFVKKDKAFCFISFPDSLPAAVAVLMACALFSALLPPLQHSPFPPSPAPLLHPSFPVCLALPPFVVVGLCQLME